MLKARLIVHDKMPGRRNMAVDEALLLLYQPEKHMPIIRFYMWRPSTVSIGFHQKLEDSVNIEKIRLKGFELVRRPTGGGALLHAEDLEITYSVILPLDFPCMPNDVVGSATFITRGIISALKRLGINASHGTRFSGTRKYALCYFREAQSDIKVQGRKISGSAQRRLHKALLQHGTLLIGFRPEDWYEVIKVPSGTTLDDLKKSIVSLKDLGVDVDTDTVLKALIRGFSDALNVEFVESELKDEEEEFATELEKRKYGNHEWTFHGCVRKVGFLRDLSKYV
ncbi:MAG: lipoate--protein ligase family protein [Candidatus Baldrarchaeia archaeon]